MNSTFYEFINDGFLIRRLIYLWVTKCDFEKVRFSRMNQNFFKGNQKIMNSLKACIYLERPAQ
jgi:hypothetical protein